MESVDILGDEIEFGDVTFEFDQSEMARIGMDGADAFAPPGVPIPDELGISQKRLPSCEVFGLEVGPEAGLSIPKCGNAAFGGDPRAGEDGDAPGLPQGSEERGRKRGQHFSRQWVR
jgi:hypothetical protein